MGEAKHNFKKHGRASVKTVCYILCRLMIPDGSQMENISHWFAVICLFTHFIFGKTFDSIYST
jgi:hypothetical protein